MSAPTTTNAAGALDAAGPSPSGVAGLVHHRLMLLAHGYEQTAEEVTAAAARLWQAHAEPWHGRAATSYRARLSDIQEDLEKVVHDYRELGVQLRTAASALSSQVAAAEQFLDLGGMGSAILGVLAQAGYAVPQHEPGGLSG